MLHAITLLFFLLLTSCVQAQTGPTNPPTRCTEPDRVPDFPCLVIEFPAGSVTQVSSGVARVELGAGTPGTDATAIHEDVAGEIAAIVDKATPVAADHLLIEDSAAANAKKDITIASLETAFELLLDLPDLQGILPLAKIDTALSTDAELAAHAATTTSVHGIANTAALITGSSPTITTPNITLPDGAGSPPTTDGQLKYDRSIERLQVGTGAATSSFARVGTLTNGLICIWDAASAAINCDSAGGGGGGGDAITVAGNAIDTTANFVNTSAIQFTFTDGPSGGPDMISATLGSNSVSAAELNAPGVKAELEGVLVLGNLQGTLGDAKIDDTITLSNITQITTRSVLSLSSPCADALVLGGTATATGVECQVDDDMPESGDFGAAAALEADGSLSTDSVSANALDATGVKTELEAVLVLANLQGTLGDAKIDDTLTITFPDPDSKFAATTVTAALAELDDNNTIGPNQADYKLHWSQIGGMPAGFADGDDGGGVPGSGDQVTVGGVEVDTIANFVSTGSVTFTHQDGATGGPDGIQGNVAASSLTASHMANADHGQVVWSSSVATVQGLQSGTEFPLTPASGDMAWLTQDSASGMGNSSVGTAQTLCRWNGSAWQCIGTDVMRNTKADCSGDIGSGLWCRDSDDGSLYLGDGTSAVSVQRAITMEEARVTGNIDDTATSAATAPTWGGSNSRCRIYEDPTLGATIECFAVAGGTVLTFDEVIYNADPKRWILHNGGSRDTCWTMDDTGLVTFAALESCGSFAGNATFSGLVTHTGGLKKSPTYGTADSYTMLPSDCGTTIANADADALTVNLIADPTGCVVCVYAESAQAITIDPNGSDSIIVSGSTLAPGDPVVLPATIGENFCLQGKDTLTWWGFRSTGTGGGGGLTSGDIGVTVQAFDSDLTVIAALECDPDEVIRRNAGSTAWECGTVSAGITSPLVIPGDDAAVTFDPVMGGETQWWCGVNHNADGVDNDPWECRTSATPGTSVKFQVTSAGEFILSASASEGGSAKYCEDADGTPDDCVKHSVPDGRNLPTGTTTFTFDAQGRLQAAAIAGSYTITASKAASYTLGTDNAGELYGGVIYVTAAATITVPLIQPGMSFTVITIGNVAVSIDPNSADTITLDGSNAGFAAGDKITNTSTAGDMAVCTYMGANALYCASGSNDGDPWTDTN